MSICIHIPNYEPDARIGGNKRGHWSSTAAAVKLAREYGYSYGMDWRGRHDPNDILPLTGRLRATYTITGKTRLDIDNAVMACKPILDGFVDAGLFIDDSQIKSMHAYIVESDDNSVTIIIEELWK